jgi:hypothetical protein
MDRKKKMIGYSIVIVIIVFLLGYGTLVLLALSVLPNPEETIIDYFEKETIEFKIIEMKDLDEYEETPHQARYKVVCDCKYKKTADQTRKDGMTTYYFTLIEDVGWIIVDIKESN